MNSDLIPPCPAGSQHPYTDLKRGMKVLYEENERVIFGCMACLEVNRTQQVIVRTLPRGWKRALETNRQRIRSNAAEFMRRNQNRTGRLTVKGSSPHAP